MSKAAATPETRLKKLRRLESNLTCPNCGTAAPQGLGFGNVCVKFNTFICDLCKTSHQAISHRVKSITMSNWTHDEVNALTGEYGGGNEAALHIWLGNAPPCGQKYRGGARPREGDRIDIFKKFISDCYDFGMFRSNTPFVPAAASVNRPAPAPAAPAGSGAAPSPARRTGTTGQLPAPISTTTQSRNSSSASSGSSDPFGFSEDPFSQPPSSQANRNSAAAPLTTNLLFDAFQDTLPMPVSVHSSSGFDFISGEDPFSSSANHNASTGFDAFSSASSSPVPPSKVHNQIPSASISGFDFIGTSPAEPSSAGGSGFPSSNDLIGLSSTPPPISSTSQVMIPPAVPATVTNADPFGSVFLQPTPLSRSASAPSATPTPNSVPNQCSTFMGQEIVSTGMSQHGMGQGMGRGMGQHTSQGMIGQCMNPGMMRQGMGQGMVSGMGQGMVSGPGQGMVPGMGQGMVPGMGQGQGVMGQGMMGPGASQGVMGQGVYGQQGGYGLNVMRPAGTGQGMMGNGMNNSQYGMGARGGAPPPAPGGLGYACNYVSAPGRLDAIGSAFGDLTVTRNSATTDATVKDNKSNSSFDFIQSSMKQQLGSSHPSSQKR